MATGPSAVAVRPGKRPPKTVATESFICLDRMQQCSSPHLPSSAKLIESHLFAGNGASFSALKLPVMAAVLQKPIAVLNSFHIQLEHSEYPTFSVDRMRLQAQALGIHVRYLLRVSGCGAPFARTRAGIGSVHHAV